MLKNTTVRVALPESFKQDDLKELAFMYSVRLLLTHFGSVYEITGYSCNMLYFVWALGQKDIPFNLIK